MLLCSYCKLSKPDEDFYIQRKSKRGRQIYCKLCGYERRRNNYKNILDNSLFKRYGITYWKYLNMYADQNGRCWICYEFKEALGEGKDANSVLNVDHNHETGRIRGLLCSKCNFALGHFDDDPEKLRHALVYLEEYK